MVSAAAVRLLGGMFNKDYLRREVEATERQDPATVAPATPRLKTVVHKTQQNYQDLRPAWHVPAVRDHRPRLLIQARSLGSASVIQTAKLLQSDESNSKCVPQPCKACSSPELSKIGVKQACCALMTRSNALNKAMTEPSHRLLALAWQSVADKI